METVPMSRHWREKEKRMAEPLNVVIDISHHNGANLNFVQAKQDGIVGVIHKATQGFTFKDKRYEENRTKARDAGLLWGAYHFGVGGDGSEQADHFLNIVNPDPDTLLVLDYEPNLTGSTMTLAQAQEFVSHVAAIRGRFPGLYSGHLIKEQLGNVLPPHSVFSQCFLWLAQYSQAPTNIPPTWPTWTLWQYTDGNVGPTPHSVAGIGDCDRDKFNGSLANLKKLWGVES
jgi:lysozyme